MNIIDIINDEYRLISEKIYNIDDDVDFIYEHYFKEDIIKVNKGIYTNIFKHKFTSSIIFNSKILKKAHDSNEIIIEINNKNIANGYDFRNKIMYLGINKNAFDFIKDYPNIEIAVKKSGYNHLYNEFSEKKVKSSIRHELTHYIDDTFTNVFKKRKIFKTDDNFKDYRKKNYEYFDKFEINAVIGNIFELKRHINYDKWNTITFEEMLDLIPQLNVIKTTMKKIDMSKYNKWKRDILTRMSREGLLGNNMKFG